MSISRQHAAAVVAAGTLAASVVAVDPWGLRPFTTLRWPLLLGGLLLAVAISLPARAQVGGWIRWTALAFLAWFIFAPQCISTIAVTRRETNGWKWPMFMVGYLFVVAYVVAGITYWTAVAFGLG